MWYQFDIHLGEPWLQTMEELILDLMRGEPRAFERFVALEGDRIYRFVKRLAGTRWADDAVQEVFLRLHREFSKYAPTGSFRAWVYTVASRVCIDFLRRQRGPDTTRRTGADESTDPAEVSELQETREAVLRAVGELPLEQRQVFLLREEAGLTFREISEMMGVSVNTTQARMRYGAAALRRRLSGLVEPRCTHAG